MPARWWCEICFGAIALLGAISESLSGAPGDLSSTARAVEAPPAVKAPAQSSAPPPAKTAAETAVGVTAEAALARAIRPQRTTPLFNGRDLTGWTTWRKDTGRKDPGGVYGVRDGVLRISGSAPGYLATEREYRDYHLVVEYKWGAETYGEKTVRNSGVLLHAVGPDGGASGQFMTSLECQVAQGCVGDLIVIRGKDERGQTIPATLTSETVVASDGRTRWKPGGKKTVYSGRQFWWKDHEPGFQEMLDTRGKHDVDSRLGEWTKLECVCRGERITILVNGHTVNEAFDCFPRAGKILLESEGFEILFRKVELQPLAAEPEKRPAIAQPREETR